MRSVMIVSFGVLLLVGVVIMAQKNNKQSGSDCPPSSTAANGVSNEQAAQFECLPDDVTLKDVVTYSLKAEKNVTVRDKLIELKAKCENGKLVDDHHKEIRFFRLQCWGNPPADYEERQARQQEELEKLEEKYTVVVMGCNPRLE